VRQIAATGAVVALLLGLSACDGGGVDLGAPPDAAQLKPIDMSNKMDKMKEARKIKSAPAVPPGQN
jgi:hypothetical protein